MQCSGGKRGCSVASVLHGIQLFKRERVGRPDDVRRVGFGDAVLDAIDKHIILLWESADAAPVLRGTVRDKHGAGVQVQCRVSLHGDNVLPVWRYQHGQ